LCFVVVLQPHNWQNRTYYSLLFAITTEIFHVILFFG
jgi:hypothetical protein